VARGAVDRPIRWTLRAELAREAALTERTIRDILRRPSFGLAFEPGIIHLIRICRIVSGGLPAGTRITHVNMHAMGLDFA
jgi:hypothetical protein